ncbi:maleylpyruvate isomerase family mycothiol-dependent enzyme [Streptomyces sp. 8N616]|uniref:maleylpyruvate isomerase family mycothiol-dependent enzyme n=1 Tax=Streptomyces sp. 8N616 TaxID=3457414 RepID=UPI003FD54BA6
MTRQDLTQAVERLGQATARLLRSAEHLDNAAARGASLLPGWSRGHVISHMARNADGMVNLLSWARTGVETPMYPSAEHRAADIEAGSTRSAHELLRDLRASTEQLAQHIRTMPQRHWGHPVSLINGTRFAASQVLWHRLKEVEIHHCDLDIGYAPRDWDPAFCTKLLEEVVTFLRSRADVPALRLLVEDSDQVLTMGEATHPSAVSGHRHDLLAWLIGRGSAARVHRVPGGELPLLPPWT